jgi:nucleoside diphosphate kinase
LNRDKEWAGVFAAFPAVRQDVQCALRCFGFDQYTAAVFHMMRVAEVGLRAVAKERKFKLPKDKPIDAAQWGELTTRLNTAIEKISNWKAKDDKKQPALSFYTAVRADTVFFKDRYRNLVSHSTAHFSVEDANSVIRRVREFMGVVSSRLDETAKPIRWTK